MTKDKFRVCYSYMPLGERLHTEVCKKFKRLTQARKYLYGLDLLPKDGKNENIFKRTGRIEQLKVTNIHFLNNKKEKGWKRIIGFRDLKFFEKKLELSDIEKSSAIRQFV